MKFWLPGLLLLVSIAVSARRYEAVTFTHDGLVVAARITFPDGTGPYRTIVLVPGSGANDKDGTIPMAGGNAACLYAGLLGDTLRPYKGLSDALADSGYAVLTYDKVEYSNPGGLGTITLHKLWFPALSGIDYLRSRSDIRGNELVLIGHSEGSTLIPRMAAGDPGISALISIAGPRRSVYDTILSYQMLEIARRCGGDTAMARLQGAQLMQYFATIRSGSWSGSTPPFAGVSAAVWSDYIKMADSVALYYNAFGRPRLFVGLGDDINVPVSTELARFRTEISGADFYELPGINHYLSTAADARVPEALSDTIVAWLRRALPPVGIPSVTGGRKPVFSLARSGGGWLLRSDGEVLRQVAVYDSNGRRVFQAKPGSLSYELHPGGLAAGIYSVELRGKETREVFRLVVE